MLAGTDNNKNIVNIVKDQQETAAYISGTSVSTATYEAQLLLVLYCSTRVRMCIGFHLLVTPAI